MVILGSLNEEVKEISLQDLTFATKKKKKEACALQNLSPIHFVYRFNLIIQNNFIAKLWSF